MHIGNIHGLGIEPLTLPISKSAERGKPCDSPELRHLAPLHECARRALQLGRGSAESLFLLRRIALEEVAFATGSLIPGVPQTDARVAAHRCGECYRQIMSHPGDSLALLRERVQNFVNCRLTSIESAE
jgi:hypothetical protein